MLYEIINIRNIPDEEYRTAAALQPDELKKRLENCKDADIKHTLAGRILLFKMIKRFTEGIRLKSNIILTASRFAIFASSVFPIRVILRRLPFRINR